LLIAFLLGIIYIISFLGAVYYGIDLCQKFRESAIGKPIKIILVLTPIAFIFYTPLLKIYPEKIVSINATVGILEILSLVYFMIWKTIYIIVELLFRSFIFIIRILIYMLIVFLGFGLMGIDISKEDYVLLVVIGYRLFEIRSIIYENFRRIYGNLIFNLRCIFSFS